VDTLVTERLREFVVCTYLLGDVSRTPADDALLIEEGILDSIGVLEIIEFLEEEFGIEVEEAETVSANLGSIAGLARYVLSKRSAA